MSNTTPAPDPDPAPTLESLLPSCTVSYGWHLAGPGPARYGWGATTCAGKTVYLGRSRAAAAEAARALGPSWGS